MFWTEPRLLGANLNCFGQIGLSEPICARAKTQHRLNQGALDFGVKGLELRVQGLGILKSRMHRSIPRVLGAPRVAHHTSRLVV